MCWDNTCSFGTKNTPFTWRVSGSLIFVPVNGICFLSLEAFWPLAPPSVLRVANPCGAMVAKPATMVGKGQAFGLMFVGLLLSAPLATSENRACSYGDGSLMWLGGVEGMRRPIWSFERTFKPPTRFYHVPKWLALHRGKGFEHKEICQAFDVIKTYVRFLCFLV